MTRHNNESNFTGASAELINALQEMIIQESVDIWMNMMGNGPAGKETLHLQILHCTLNSLLKTYRGNLIDESLQYLLVEVWAIVNSHPLTKETMLHV